MPKAVNGKKECSKCHKVKLVSGFYKDKTKADGLAYQCKECYKKHDKKYWKENSEKIKKRQKKYRLKKYGFNTSEAQKIIKLRKTSRCAICGIEAKKINYGRQKKMLYVDHCHNSQEVRGLLCDKCNMGLGYFNDDVELLKKAIKYLDNSPGIKNLT